MSTQGNTFKTTEDYMKTSSKWLSESAITMADIYSKQFKLGFDMYTNMLNGGFSSEKNKSNFSSDLFFPNIEMLRKNMDDISKLSEKTITNLMNAYSGYNGKSDEATKIIETILDGYHMQAKQIANINNQFIETYHETFKKTNEDIEKKYADFRKNTEEGFSKVEDAISSAFKKYSSSMDKSSKTSQELFDNINNQMELLIKTSLKQWSDLKKTMVKENKTSAEKAK